MLNRLEMLRIFCAAAEARNFRDAALQLGISPQAVTRAVQALEQQLGEVLFHRNTRGSQVTEAGLLVLQQARASLAQVDDIFRRQGPQRADDASGLVRMTAPEVLGEHFLVPVLAALQRHYPGLRFDLRLSDQAARVVDDKIDIGIRIGWLRDSRFVARSAASVVLPIVAAPALLDRVGVPATLAELAAQPVTAMVDANNGRPWPWFLAGGEQWQPRQPVLLANTGAAECQATLSGMGFSQLPGFVAIPHLQAGRLVQVLPALTPAPWPVSVYRPQAGPVPARVRVVFDWLLARLADPQHFPQALPADGKQR